MKVIPTHRGIDDGLFMTLARRFLFTYVIQIPVKNKYVCVDKSAKASRIHCLYYFCREETLYPLLLIAIGNDLSETVITFMRGGVKCVDVSANRGLGVRRKGKYSPVILWRPQSFTCAVGPLPRTYFLKACASRC